MLPYLGRQTVITAKVRKHLRVLCSSVKPEGLFNWKTVASLLHTADIPMQSGTVPVERLWANYVDFSLERQQGWVAPGGTCSTT